MAGKTAGTITINVNAGTAELVLGLNKANAAVENFQKKMMGAGERGVSEMKATAAVAKIVEGNILSSSRAADAFVESILHAGPLMQKLFPVAGGLAFVGILTEGISRVYEFYERMEQAPEKLAGAFRGLNSGIDLTNDALEVTKVRLENDIAKLEGRPQNGLKLALVEAQEAADKLADSLDKDIEKLRKVMEDNAPKWWDVFTVGTSDIREQEFGKAGFGGFRGELADKKGDQAAMNTLLKDHIGLLQQQLDITQLNAAANSGTLVDFENRIEILREFIRQYQSMMKGVTLTGDVAALTKQKDVLAAGAEEAKRAAEALKRMHEAVAELRGELARAQEQQVSSYARLAIEEQAELQRLAEKRELNAETLPILQQIYSVKTITAYMEALKAADKELRDAQDETDRGVTAANKTYMEALAETSAAIGKVTSETMKLNAEIAKGQTAHAVKAIGEAPGASADPVGTARRQNAVEVVAINKQYADLIASENDTEKRNNLEAEKQLALQKAQFEMEDAIAKARKKSLSELLTDMSAKAKSATDIWFDGIERGIDGLADNFAKLMTGQKTSFAKMFQHLGQGLLKETMKSSMQKGVGALGKVLGVDLGGKKKPVGTMGDPLWVRLVGLTGGGGVPGVHAPIGGPGLLGGGGLFSGSDPVSGMIMHLTGNSDDTSKSGKAIGDLLGAAGGGLGDESSTVGQSARSGAGFWSMLLQSLIPREMGGFVSPGSAYLVGEAGPELLIPRQSGSIMSNALSRRTFAGDDTYHQYQIDARGTDPVQTEMRVRAAIIAAHSSAISTGVQVQHDLLRRVPGTFKS